MIKKLTKITNEQVNSFAAMAAEEWGSATEEAKKIVQEAEHLWGIYVQDKLIMIVGITASTVSYMVGELWLLLTKYYKPIHARHTTELKKELWKRTQKTLFTRVALTDKVSMRFNEFMKHTVIKTDKHFTFYEVN